MTGRRFPCTRWFSPENPTATRSRAGLANQGAKGRAFVPLEPGSTLSLADTRAGDATGPGRVGRIWLTLSDLSAKTLSLIRLRMFWDDAEQPAVDLPVAAFFGAPTGELVPFESVWLSSPEGRSFCSTLPMPFVTAARIELVNDGQRRIDRVFYEVAVEYDGAGSTAPAPLWLHAGFRETAATGLDGPFVALSHCPGRGRLLGLQLGVTTDPAYHGLWWGEGEVRARFGDDPYPTLSGTGIEDWVGTGWGMGPFSHRSQGCPLAGAPVAGAPPTGAPLTGAPVAGSQHDWTPYRFHPDDPVWFDDGLEITVDAIGGGPVDDVLAARDRGAAVAPITVDQEGGHLRRLLDETRPEDADEYPAGWMNFRRSDHYRATVWLLLDRP